MITFVSLFVILPLVALIFAFPPSFDLSRYASLIATNLLQATVSAAVALIGGMTISYLLAHRKMPAALRSFVHSISKVSFVFPGVSMALGFLITLGKNGLLNRMFSPFGIHVDLLYTLLAVVIGHAFYNIPVVVYITGTTWEKLSGDVVEAAEIDGASSWKILRSVEIPLLLPSIVSSYLMAFLYSFTSFAVVMTIGGFRYRTLEVEIYSKVSMLDFSGASSLTIVQMLIVATAAISASLLKSRDFPSGIPKLERKGSLSLIFSSLFLAGILVPMISSLLYGFFNQDAFRLLSERGFEFLGESLSSILFWSFSIAVSAAAFSTTVSTISGKSSSRGRALPGVFSSIPTAVSTAVLAFAYLTVLIKFFTEDLSQIALVILHSSIALPMSHRIMESGWMTVPREVEEAAMVDGAGKFRTFFFVDLPMIIPAIVRAFTLSMAISLSELAGVLILSGGKFMTLSSAVYRLMSSRHFAEATALNSIFVLIVLGIFFLGEFATQKL